MALKLRRKRQLGLVAALLAADAAGGVRHAARDERHLGRGDAELERLVR